MVNFLATDCIIHVNHVQDKENRSTMKIQESSLLTMIMSMETISLTLPNLNKAECTPLIRGRVGRGSNADIARNTKM